MLTRNAFPVCVGACACVCGCVYVHVCGVCVCVLNLQYFDMIKDKKYGLSI